jgi:DNA-binding CsgD family transcriptional regulator
MVVVVATVAMVLVGRELERESVRTAIDSQGAVLVAGRPGVGKTALVRDVLRSVGAGRQVRLGASVPALRHRSYQVLSGAFDLNLASWEPAQVVRALSNALAPDDVLVVEDLQWADRSSLDVLGELVGRCGLLATWQTGTPHDREVEEWATAFGLERLELGLLSPSATAELIARRRPDLLAGERRRLAAASGGLPLVACLLADRAESTGGELGRALDGGSVATVSAMLLGLSPSARSGLAAFSIGPLALRVDDVLGAPELLRLGLVEVGPTGRLTVLHRLLADLAAELMTPEELRAEAERLAELDELDGVTRARLRLQAGEPVAALELLLEAANGPLPRAEQAAALQLAVQAAVAAGDHGLELDLAELRIRAATALNDAILHAEAAEALGSLHDYSAGHRLAATVQALRATLGSGDRRGARELVDDAAGVLDGADGVAAVHGRLLAQLVSGPAEPSDELLAAERLLAAGDLAERSRAALLVGLASARHLGHDDVTAAAAWFEIARDQGARAGELASELEAMRNLVLVTGGLGDLDRCRELARRGAERAIAAGAESWTLEFRTLETISRLNQGTDDEGLSFMSYIRTAPVRLETRAMATSALAIGLADGGNAARSAQVLSAWTEPDRLEGLQPMPAAMILWAVVQRAWILGELDDAISVARQATRTLPPGFVAIAGIQVVWRWCEYESGRVLSAPDPVGGLQPAASLEARAIAHLARGEPALAVPLFEQAAASWATILRRCELRARWGAGLALAADGRADQAMAALAAVDAELDEAGCPALRTRVRTAMRSLVSTAARPIAGSAGRSAVESVVSPAEREVLGLVATGLRTPAIATRLGISVETVNSHVRSAVRKLGARNRVDAAERLAWLERRTPPPAR